MIRTRHDLAFPVPECARSISHDTMSVSERESLWHALRYFSQHHNVIEVGVWQGYTAEFICRCLQWAYGNYWNYLGIDFKLRVTKCRRACGEFVRAGRARFVEHDSVFPEYHGYAGLVLIDADHRTRFAERDIRFWYDRVWFHGFLAIHDTNDPRVKAAVENTKDILGKHFYPWILDRSKDLPPSPHGVVQGGISIYRRQTWPSTFKT